MGRERDGGSTRGVPAAISDPVHGVTGFTTDDVTVTGGTKGEFGGSGTGYTLVVTPAGTGDVTVTVGAGAATDEAGNAGPAADVSATAAAGTLTGIGVPAAISSTAAFTATFEFTEAVTGFTTDDVTVTGGTKGEFGGSGTDYTLVVTPAGTGDVTATVTVRANAATDEAGNAGPAADVSATAAWQEDRTPPTLQAITGVPAAISSTAAFTATFEFTEAVTGFTTGDVTVAGGTKGEFGGSGTDYTLVVTPAGTGDVTVTVGANAATDEAGNAGPAADVSATAVWDATPPGLTITGVPAAISSTAAFTATFEFTEAVTGFTTGDVTVTGGTKGEFGGSGTGYTLEVTPAGTGDVTVTVGAGAATDEAGNAGPAADVSATAVWDATPPGLTITGVPAAISSTAAFTATFEFTEAVTGFTTDDVTVTGGTKGEFGGSGTGYTLVVTPAGTGDVTVTVGAGAATDEAGNAGPAADVSATAVWDATPPGLTITGVPAAISSTAAFTATFEFTEAVTGFTTDDVTVTGGTKGEFGGSGTGYTLEVTPAGTGDVTVTVGAGAATDEAGNAGPAADVSATAVWDATPPGLTITGVPAAISSTAAFTATFEFTEAVAGFTTGDVTVTGGTKGEFGGSGTGYTLEVTPAGTGDVTVTVGAGAATDEAGNAGPAADVSATAVWDATPPGLTITGVPAAISSTAAFTATFEFTEAVTGFTTGDVTVTGGTKGEFGGSGTGYTLVVTPAGTGDVTVTVGAGAATDEAGNAGPAADVSATAVWDATPPGLTITGVPAAISSTAAFTATFEFTEAVTGFTTGDVTVTGGTKGEFGGSGTDYTLVVTPAGTGDVTVTVGAGAATDEAGNAGPAADVSATAVWDATPPGLTITEVPAAISSTAAFTATFEFTEAVTGFTTGDVTVTGGTKGEFGGSGTGYTLVVTPAGTGDVTVTVGANAATDEAGNAGPAADVSATAVWDATPPGLTITGVPAAISSTAAFTATFEFTEAVAGFTTGDVTVTGGTKGEFGGSGTGYTLEVTPAGTGDVTVTVGAGAATDEAGNAGPAADVSATAVWDATPPGLTITGVPAAISSTAAFTATFEFTEAVTGFTTGDVTVTGGTKGEFGGSGTGYTLVVTPAGTGDVTVTVGAGAATDEAGNAGPAADVSATAVWDATPPGLTITGVPAAISSTAAFTATFEFTEPVTGFTTGDVTVTGGTKGEFGGSGTGYTLVVTPAGTGDVTVTVGANAATDEAGNAGPAEAVTVTAANPVRVTVSQDTLRLREGSTATYDVGLSRAPSGPVTVTVASGDSTAVDVWNRDDWAATTTLEFTAAQWTPQSVDVVAQHDSDAVDDTVSITHVATSQVDENYRNLAGPSVALTVADDDTAAIAVCYGSECATALSVAEGSTERYGVTLRTEPAADVTVTVNSPDPAVTVATGDGEQTFSTTATLSFTAADYYQAQYVTVRAREDIDGVDETVNLSHTASGSSPDYNGVSGADMVVTVSDTTSLGVLISVPAAINSTAAFTATFEFTEAVTGFTADDVTVENGTKGEFGGSGTGYTLVVTPSDSADVIVTVAAASVEDGAGNAGPAQAGSATARWDVTSPGVVISMPAGINSTAFTATFEFTEAVTGFTTDDVTVENGTKGEFGGSGRDYTLEVTPTDSADVTVTVGANAATDEAGNAGPAADVSATAAWDATPPGLQISVPDEVVGAAAFTATFTFTEAVTGFTADDVTVENGTKGAFGGSGRDYTLEVTSAGTGDVTVTVGANAATDEAGNAGPAQAVTVTAANPVRVTVSQDTLHLREGDTSTYDVGLSRAPSGPVTVTVASGDSTAVGVWNRDDWAATTTLEFTAAQWTPQSVNVVARHDLDAVDDTVSITHVATSQVDENYRNLAGPSVALTVAEGDTAAIAVCYGSECATALSVAEGSTERYGVTLRTEPAADVTVTVNSPDPAVTVATGDGEQTFSTTATLSFTAADYYQAQYVTVRAREDIDGVDETVNLSHTASGSSPDYNGVSGADMVVTVSDTTSLGVLISVPAAINSTAAFTATFEFTEAVTGFTADDVTVENGTKGEFGGSGTGYTLVVTPSDSADVIVTVAAASVEDGAGNAGPAQAGSATARWDVTSPGVVISMPAGINSTAFTATFEFTEAVTGFTTDDVTVENGTKGEFGGSGRDYTLEVTPADSADVTVTVGANAATDEVGNAGPAADVSATAAWDATPPGLQISVPDEVVGAAAFTATFTFTEAVTGFTADDVTVTGGEKGAFGGSGTGYTLEVTSAGTGDVTVTVGAGAATDGVGNAGPAQAVTVTAANPVRVTVSQDTLHLREGSTATYDVGLSRAPSGPVTVTVASGDSTAVDVWNRDDWAATTTLEFTAAQWTPQSVDVVAQHDSDAVDDTVSITHVATSQVDENYRNLAGPSVALTVAEGDTAAIAVCYGSECATALSVAEGSTERYGVTLRTEPAADVTVTVNSPDPAVTVATGDGEQTFSTTATLSFTAADYYQAQYVTVRAREDIDGVDETVNLSHTASGSSPDYNGVSGADMVVTVSDTTSLGVLISVPAAINSTAAFTATFEFTEAVTGFTADDVTVENGTKGEFGGSGTGYTLVVTPSDSADVIVTVAAASVEDGAGNAGPAQAGSATARWDVTSPGVVISMPAGINSTAAFTATFEFTEAVTGFTADDVTVENGTKGAFGGSGRDYTLEVTPTDSADVTVTVGANAATDEAGNAGPAADVSATAAWDATPPGLEIFVPDEVVGAAAFTATFEFTEAVTGFTADDVTVTGGEKGAFGGSGRDYTLVVTSAGTGDVTVTVGAGAATDGVGNAGPAAEVSATAARDATPPGLEISVPDEMVGVAAFTAAFNFDEPVTGFETGDVTVTGGEKGAFGGSGKDYTLEVTPSGTAEVAVTVGAGAAQDGVGNAGPAAEVSATAARDATPPGLEISVPAAINSAAAFTATFEFTEPVTGFGPADVTVDGGAKGTFGGGGARYTLELIPPGTGAVTVKVAAGAVVDGLGNAGPATEVIATAAWDSTALALEIGVPDEVVGAEAFTATFEFSEPVTGFDAEDVKVTGGAKGAFGGRGANYTLAVTPFRAVDVTVAVTADAVVDGVGNAGPAAAVSATAARDATPPGLRISVPAGINSAAAFTAAFEFTEPVTGFGADDVTVIGGMKGAFGGGGTSYTLVVTPEPGIDATVAVRALTVQDGAGNVGPAAAVSATAAWDATPPGLEISVPDEVVGAAAFTAAFTFTEPVTGFGADDVTVIGGTKGAFGGGRASYTLVVTPEPGIDVVVAVRTNAAQDGAGNVGPAAEVSATAARDATSPGLEISVPDEVVGAAAFTATFEFTEPVTGFGADHVTVTNGAKGTFLTTSSSIYTLAVTPEGGVEVTVAVGAGAAQDGAGNAGPAAEVSATAARDATAPRLEISVPAGINSTASFTAAFAFTEPVTGFETGDVTVTGGTKGVFGGTGTDYTLEVTPSGTGGVTVTVGAAAAADGASNMGPVAEVSATAAWDATPPGLQISVPDEVVGAAAFTAAFTFTEAVTGFTADDVTVTGGTKGAFAGSGDGLHAGGDAGGDGRRDGDGGCGPRRPTAWATRVRRRR